VSVCGCRWGLTGLWLAAECGEAGAESGCVQRRREDWTQESWDARIQAVRREGMAAVGAGFWSAGLRLDFTRSRRSRSAMETSLLSIDVDGYAAGCAAVRDADFREGLSGLAVPTLVVNGASDPGGSAFGRHALSALDSRAMELEFCRAHLFTMERLRNLRRRAGVSGFRY